jgi:hypothetical protein
MSHPSKNQSRFLLCLAAVLPLAVHAACASSNGAAVGSQTFDASPLDPGDKNRGEDAGAENDGAPKDAAPEVDAAEDAKPDAANTAPVEINEIYVDNAFLRGDATEYVELRGAAGVPVDDLKLRILYADGTVKYEVAVGNAGEKFGANGLWVVGGTQTFKLNVTDHVDHSLSTSVFGLDVRGAVQLLRGGVLLDVVGYGSDPDAGAVPPPLTQPTATSEGRVARTATQPTASSAPAKAIGRASGAADTNVNAVDFCTMVASPGFAQKPCE